MRRYWIVGLLTIASFALTSQYSDAGLFECLRCRKCWSYIKVMPYNAFTPISSGTFNIAGTIPMTPGGGGGLFGHGRCGLGGCGMGGYDIGFGGYPMFGQPSNFSTGCCDGNSLPPVDGGKTNGSDGQELPKGDFTPPEPNPAGNNVSFQGIPQQMPVGNPQQMPVGNPYQFTGYRTNYYQPTQGYNMQAYGMPGYGMQGYGMPYYGMQGYGYAPVQQGYNPWMMNYNYNNYYNQGMYPYQVPNYGYGANQPTGR